MKRAATSLALALIAVLAGVLWWLLSPASEPVIPEPAVTGEAESRAPATSLPSDAAVDREEELEPPTDDALASPAEAETVSETTPYGIRVLRADGSPARGLNVVFGDYLAGTDGEQARQHVWKVTDDQGRALLLAGELVQLLRFSDSDRSYYVAAHFPYLGPAQVLAPLDLELESEQLPPLQLRPAGAIEVDGRRKDGAPLADSHRITLLRSPRTEQAYAERRAGPFRSPGSYDGAAELVEGRARMDWIGVGVEGLIAVDRRLRPTTWSYGPLSEGAVAKAQLTFATASEEPLRWTFDLVDPQGRPTQPVGSLMWLLSIEREGVTWHHLGGPVLDTDAARRQILFQETPPLLPNDRALLRFRTLREGWSAIDVTVWMRPGASDLGTLALGPLPVQAAGRVVGPDGAGIGGLRVQLVSLRDPDQRGQAGTDADGNFELRGEPIEGGWQLSVGENAFVLGKTLELAAARQDLVIELRARFPVDD